jgi:hypothetical protein
MRRWATRTRPRWGSTKSAISPASTATKDTEAAQASVDGDEDNKSSVGINDNDDNGSLVSLHPDDDESVSVETANTNTNTNTATNSEITSKAAARDNRSQENNEQVIELLDSSIETLASSVAQVVLASRTLGRPTNTASADTLAENTSNHAGR